MRLCSRDRRRRVLVAYAGNELVLGALHGPQHDRVSHVFHRRERRVRRISQAHVRDRHAALPQRQRRQQPVSVGLHHGLPVHRRYAPVVEHGQRVYGPVVIDAPFQDHVQVHVPAVEFEDLPGCCRSSSRRISRRRASAISRFSSFRIRDRTMPISMLPYLLKGSCQIKKEPASPPNRKRNLAPYSSLGPGYAPQGINAGRV